MVKRHTRYVSKNLHSGAVDQKLSKWSSCLDLSSIPTKAEELDVKVDKKTESARDGVTIFSSHIWAKDILIPEDVELETIALKLHDDKLTFVAERGQEDRHQEITIEMEDTSLQF